MTVEEFLALALEGRAELEDGVLYMMSGGTAAHSAIAANIIAALRPKLRGTGCRPMTSDFAVKTGANTVRMPDVSVYCGMPLAPERDRDQLLGDPKVVFEILSPSTRSLDLRRKLDEYRALDGIDAIVFIDPETERARLVERTAREAWADAWLEPGATVAISSLGVTLTADEIFARD